jgi:hypothetical protein
VSSHTLLEHNRRVSCVQENVEIFVPVHVSRNVIASFDHRNATGKFNPLHKTRVLIGA